MREWPLDGDGRFGSYLIADSSEYSDIARSVECTVFQEFFGNVPAVMTEAYAAYEAHSKFLLIVDRELQQPAGSLRIIENSPAGLKTFNDIEEAPLSIPRERAFEHHDIVDLDRCWDVGALAVLKNYRGKATGNYVSTALYGLFYVELCKAGIEHVVAILDSHAWGQLTRTFGLPFVTIMDSKPFSYLGSEENYAAYLHVPGAGQMMQDQLAKVERSDRRLLTPHLSRMVRAKGLPTAIEVT